MPKSSKGHVGYSGVLNPATVVFICAVALSILGITVLFSASLPLDKSQPYRFIEKQALWMGLTSIVGLCLLKLNLEWMRRFIWVGYVLLAFGLVAVLVPGVGHWVNGSRSWIRFGPFGIQVAEFAKIGLIFFVAHYFSCIRKENGTFLRGFIYPCLGIGLYVGLVILQPDLGTALVMSMVAICLLYLAGVKLYYLIPSVTAGFAGVVALIYNDAERWSRLTAFWNMEAEKAGDAYQGWQALLAFGAGGIDGVGLGNGRQQLSFLPEAHNDFIFAIVGEELGLIATLAVVTIYAVMFFAGVLHIRRAPNTYHFLLSSGCVLVISVQALLNLGVVTGVLPTTGLPLPFISYGGSNFLTMGICVAILLNTSIAWRNPALEDSKRKLKDI
ncbi:putative peptidoglycan glycosyltransferase FtsW [Pelagicoccus sp. SDUM812003]|uniref:FtsW/RodA/SpoVE family cell cycle protein n=1 Tax=Pelagicoccus sp. SDUM812003 TaxID=3041267 RepID=UPI00280C80EF|nr:putative peptidoglycan glycosyltransferase FtsW [Pelagicoccus sp. SDUM812003]MDQ8204412.1 putative peptidoglycan glycosyltransferase FtsW [Pelagicoccus sp. SDUM812003]